MSRHLSILALAASIITVSCTAELPEQPSSPSRETDSSHRGVILMELSDQFATKVESELTKGDFLATKSAPLNSAFSEIGVIKVERLFEDGGKWEARHRKAGLHRYYRVIYDPHVKGTKAASVLETVDGILSTEKEYDVIPDALVFNDPALQYQWHYINNGSKDKTVPLTPGCDINVLPVWQKYSAGSSNVIVAVVDGGIDPDHNDLSGVLIPGGPEGSKNFVDNSYTIIAHRHGTHVGGTIGAINNNGIGVCGIAGGKSGKGGVRLLSCQVYKKGTDGDISGGHYNALVWAADHGAVIVNNSWSISYKTAQEAAAGSVGYFKPAIDYFIRYAGCDDDGNQLPDSPMKGGLVFFSAGNNNWPDGWPAEYSLAEPHVIAVGAIGPTFNKAYYSSYGGWVTMCAPGGDSSVNSDMVFSTVPYNTDGRGYACMQGTSMSCPHATGVAALVLSNCGGPGFTNDKLREKLVKSARRGIVKPDDAKIGPLIDAFKAVCYGEKIAPDDVTDFRVSALSSSRVQFKFYVGNDDNNDMPSGYLVLAAKKASDFDNFNPKNIPSTIKYADHRVGTLKKGDIMTADLDGLEQGTRYVTSIVAYDEDGLYSKIVKKTAVYTQKSASPVISTAYDNSGVISRNGVLTIDFTVTDTDGNLKNVKISSGESEGIRLADLSSGKYRLIITGSGFTAGTFSVTVSATDADNNTATHTFIFKIVSNRAPEICVTRESDTSYLITVTDPDGDKFGLAFSPGSNAAESKEVSGFATLSDGSSAASWRMTVSDSSGASGRFTAKYTATDINGASSSYSINYKAGQ